MSTTLHAEVLGPERQKLKRDYLKSLSADTGRQTVGLTLRDGRRVKLVIEYVDDGKGIRVKRRHGNTICVTFDRSEVIKASLAQDAMLVCGATKACSFVEAYVADLHRVSSKFRFKLFEEFIYHKRDGRHKQVVRSMKNWQRTQMYARQWLAMFQRYILTFQLHEIGHVALNHEPTSLPETLLRIESEADGFARYAANLSKHSTSPSIAVLLDRLREEKADFDPPGACRIEALTSPISEWARKYFRGDRTLERAARRAEQAAREDERPFRFGLPVPPTKACQTYANGFRDGILAAASVVDENTHIMSDPEWGARCPTSAAGN